MEKKTKKSLKKEMLKIITAKINFSLDKRGADAENRDSMMAKVKEVALGVATEWLIESSPCQFACELAEMAGMLYEKAPEAYEDFLILIGKEDPESTGLSGEKEKKSEKLSKVDRFRLEANNVNLIGANKRAIFFMEDAPKEINRLIEGENRDGLVDILRCIVRDVMGYLIAEYNHTKDDLVEYMTDIYRRKNKDYDNSFDRSLDEGGLLVAKIRIGDKINRMLSLLSKPEPKVKDESLKDTLIDMANYSIMTVLWIEEQKSKNVKEGK